MAKVSRSDIRRRAWAIPKINFEAKQEPRWTSFAGFVLFQAFLSQLRLTARLAS